MVALFYFDILVINFQKVSSVQEFSDAFENHMSEIPFKYNHNEFYLDTISRDIKEKQTQQKLQQSIKKPKYNSTLATIKPW